MKQKPIISIFLLIVILIFFVGCDSSSNEKAGANDITEDFDDFNNKTTKDSQPNPLESVQQSSSHKYTINKNFIPVQYNDDFFFGMTVSEWNSALAVLTKNGGAFNELRESGRSWNDYIASTKLRGEGEYMMTGIFEDSVSEWHDTITITHINNTTPTEPILTSIWYICNNAIPADADFIIKDFIHKNQLSFVAGEKNISITNRPVTIRDFKTINDFNKIINKDKYANKTGWDEVSGYTTTLFESNDLYFGIKITYIVKAYLSRNGDGEIISARNGYRLARIDIYVHPKIYKAVNIYSYMTYEEKEEFKARRKTNELINKALGR